MLYTTYIRVYSNKRKASFTIHFWSRHETKDDLPMAQSLMREALLTVLPKRKYLRRLVPKTPATEAPRLEGHLSVERRSKGWRLKSRRPDMT